MPKVEYSFGQAKATQAMSQDMSAIADDMRKKASDIEELQVKTSLRENLHRIYNESPGDPGTIKARADGFLKQFLSNIKNADLQQRLSITSGIELQPYLDKATEQYRGVLDEQHKMAQLTALSRNNVAIGEAAKAFMSSAAPEVRDAAQKKMTELFDESASIVAARDSKGMFQFTPEKQMSVLLDGQRTILDALPANKRIEVLGGNPGGFEHASVLLRKHEGGYNPSDGNTGQPALFGINRKWHEQAYDKIKAIYDTQGSVAGQAAADAYLKETYWDAYNLDSLKPEQQGVVYDGIVNHSAGFAKKLVEEARNGASPADLLSMRQNEYDRLAASGKYSKQDVASWNNRLADYQHLSLSDSLDLLTEDDKKKSLKEAVEQFKSEEERANIMRVMEAAAKDKAVYQRFVENSPDILQDIEDYKNNGGDPELANYMRTSALTRNKLSAGEEDQVYSNIIDRVTQLKIKTKSDGTVKIGKDDVTLPDLIRLQRDIMRAGVRGVKNLDSQLKKLSPAILEMARKERGKDDLGEINSFFGLGSFNADAYDSGYGVIQKYLEQQGKEEDYAAKAEMLRAFIEKADAIPEDIQKDDLLFAQAQQKIAAFIISKEQQKGMPNIPLPHIQKLKDAVANGAQMQAVKDFNALYGPGAAQRILGQ